MQKFGIDVSRYQGDFNFAQAKKEGVEFAILKCGGGDAGVYKDATFDTNYNKAKAAGIGIGAYFFGAAKTVAEAKAEADSCIAFLKGKQFSYPIFYDVEDARMNVGKAAATEIVKTFCGALEAAGYWCGFYTNLDWYKNKLNGAELAKRYSMWFAYWGTELPKVDGVQIWQFGGNQNFIRSNTVAGVVCDQDYCYVDFPTQIKAKGLNGYKKTTTKPTAQKQTASKPTTTPKPTTTQTKKKSVDEIAKEVIAGKWGSGGDRKARLAAAGYNYNVIQAKVDELMSAKPKKKSVDEIAREVIQGKWGNGYERKNRLTKAGYDYSAVQARVDQLMRG